MLRRIEWPIVRSRARAAGDAATRFAWPAGLVLAILHDQQSRLFLWVPVCLATGIAAYSSLPVEPPLPVFVLAAGVAVFLLWAGWAGRALPVYLALTLFLTGFVVAKLRTEFVRAPALAASSGQTQLAGWVRRADMAGANQAKVVIDIDWVSRVRRDAWPASVEMRLFKLDRPLRIGEYIQVSGRLFPLLTPVAPGAYDHGRTLWFRGIGASGRGVLASENERLTPLPDRTSWRTWIADTRAAIGRSIHAVLPPDAAAFAEALITGNRAHIKRQMRDDLSIAGLAHVLAISGLHMSLVAGGVFWLVRALLALFPTLVLAWPVKKFAAVAALGAGAAYLLLSGGAVSSQRAFIMLSVMFLAVLCDRPAFSLRNLAIAAIIILLSTPEAVLSAGFQMSFLAVMGLIAGYEALRLRRARRPRARRSDNSAARLVRLVFAMFAAIATTTLIASVFTGLPAAFHFNRIAPLGLIANIAALPIVTFVVMPMATLAVLAMPLGLESWPLTVMGWGLDRVMQIAHWVAGLPHADIPFATLPALSGFCFGAALVWLCLWPGRLRAAGIVPVVAGVLIAVNAERPDVLIERTGKNVAVRNSAGDLVLAQSRRAKYTARKWLQRDGDGSDLAAAAARSGWSCSDKICRTQVRGVSLVYARQDAIMPAHCHQADILISEAPLRGACSDVDLRIDRFDLWRNGAHAVYLGQGPPVMVTASDIRGQRPWVIKPVARNKVRLTSDTRTAWNRPAVSSAAAIRSNGPGP